ncbi:OmpA family protein [Bradyrhizobium sp.]|jgi:OmpA-OmpF porin, OOP family|uniref:OmpA family protein n=1 Tax=Bradyrhizobium sp. TaxID=376 RepID=UPI003C5BBB12
MPLPDIARRLLPLMVGLLMVAWPVRLAWSQEAPTTEAMVSALVGLEAPSDLEVPVLRQQATDRLKSKADAIALKRPPVSAQLNRLPHLNVDIRFNPDTPVIRPESYRAIGRIADALTNPALMSSTFLIVGRTESTGRRDNNLMLSQRRAEAIRDALVTTFRISSKRLLAVGLGEEQLLDADHPKSAANQQSTIVTVK